MNRLTRKDTLFKWGSECQKAFEDLKLAFTTAPVLTHFDPANPIVIETDSSDYAVEPSMGPLRDLVFTGHTAAPFSFVSPSTDTYRLLLISPTSSSTVLRSSLILLRQSHRDSSFPASSHSALVSNSTGAH